MNIITRYKTQPYDFKLSLVYTEYIHCKYMSLWYKLVSFVKFIALYTLQIVSKQLHRNKQHQRVHIQNHIKYHYDLNINCKAPLQNNIVSLSWIIQQPQSKVSVQLNCLINC